MNAPAVLFAPWFLREGKEECALKVLLFPCCLGEEVDEAPPGSTIHSLFSGEDVEEHAL